MSYHDDEIKVLLRRYGLQEVDKPKRTPNHPTKSHVVLTVINGKPKLIRFGAQGAKTNPVRKNETEQDKARRAAFKRRHAKNIARGKISPAYWSNLVKWS